MLYITTRSNRDAFTAHKTLIGDFPQDGGLYVPFQIPFFSNDDISKLNQKSFSEIVADILNIFFSARLSGWDIECSIGRNPVKFAKLVNGIYISELWHNLEKNYNYLKKGIYCLLCKDIDADHITEWAEIAIRISVLFGLFGELLRSGVVSVDKKIDIAVNADSQTELAAAWLARKMGLPIQNIVCCCHENSSVWSFIRKGTTGSCVKNRIHSIEYLIFGTLGFAHTNSYAEACGNRIYSITEDELAVLNADMFTSAIGTSRIPSVINSVLRTDNYMLYDDAAFAYGGLQDYRSSTGVNKPALILAEMLPK